MSSLHRARSQTVCWLLSGCLSEHQFKGRPQSTSPSKEDAAPLSDPGPRPSMSREIKHSSETPNRASMDVHSRSHDRSDPATALAAVRERGHPLVLGRSYPSTSARRIHSAAMS